MDIKSRRRFSKEFKAKVALEAIKERESIETLCKKYNLHPNQISQWKKTYKSGGSELFNSKTKEKGENKDKLIAELYRQIGELKVANDFLKKKLN